jgi:hypothetical protein
MLGNRMPDPPAEFLVRLRALPDRVPGPVRLRRALKCLLRSFGLRAVRVEPLPAEPGASQAAADAAPASVGNP